MTDARLIRWSTQGYEDNPCLHGNSLTQSAVNRGMCVCVKVEQMHPGVLYSCYTLVKAVILIMLYCARSIITTDRFSRRQIY